MHSLTDHLTDLVDSAPAWMVYLIACGVVYAETAIAVVGLVAPSEAVLVAAGVVAAIGRPQIGVLVAGCAVAAVAGDSTGYLIGRLAGPRLARTRAGRALVRRTVASGYEPPRAGAALATIASARWVGYVRSITPLIAGTRRMPFHRYLFATALGGVSWTATILLVSWGVGATLGGEVALIIGVCVGVGVLIAMLVRRRRVRRRRPT
ncbi:MAG: VTT domain-containing protein [Gordonia sp. (in: high G+C Gram-positive bacteria)]|uniref:DedA family protein n=1 Tax=Gordonia sp. (in: high G+C Gram-positive bacteria) TaxID=84139 RepID=UPI003C754C0A